MTYNAAKRNYYKGAKRISVDGAPMKVASWYGELGNDREYRESCKRKLSEAARAYYADGVRVVIDGYPCKLPAKPIKLKSQPGRRFKQCRYEKTCVISGHHAGLVPQGEKENKWFILLNGKVLQETKSRPVYKWDEEKRDFTDEIERYHTWQINMEFDSPRAAMLHLMDIRDGKLRKAA